MERQSACLKMEKIFCNWYFSLKEIVSFKNGLKVEINLQSIEQHVFDGFIELHYIKTTNKYTKNCLIYDLYWGELASP